MSHRLARYKLVTHSRCPYVPRRPLFVLIKGVSTAISKALQWAYPQIDTYVHTGTCTHTPKQTHPNCERINRPANTLYSCLSIAHCTVLLGQPHQAVETEHCKSPNLLNCWDRKSYFPKNRWQNFPNGKHRIGGKPKSCCVCLERVGEMSRAVCSWENSVLILILFFFSVVNTSAFVEMFSDQV